MVYVNIDGEMRDLSLVKIVTEVDEHGKGISMITKESTWKQPTTFSKMIDCTKVFAIVGIIMYGMTYFIK